MRYKKVNLIKEKNIILLIIVILIITAIFLFPAKEKGGIPIEARTRYDERSLVEARNYQKLEDNLVQCNLCFRGCIIKEGKRGTCRNRANINGTLYTLNYGKPCAIHLDPIEKEPAFHVYPGGSIFCIATAGCNFRCLFCQNWTISQQEVENTHYIYLTPKKAVQLAKESNCDAISFTYSEPTSFYEYMYDIAKLAKEEGLKVIFHTNGAMRPEPLKALLKHMDAVVVDLKGFTDEFYTKLSSAKLEPVLQTLKIIKEEGVWLEIVNLIVPTKNDDMEDIKKMCEWIKENLGEETPIHFSRFFPAYKMLKLPPTPITTLEQAREIALEVGMHYVSIGNVPGHKANSTYCPKCGNILISRVHFMVLANNIIGGRCRFCGHKIPGIWRDVDSTRSSD